MTASALISTPRRKRLDPDSPQRPRLPNILQRFRRLGGNLTVQSALGEGSTLTVTVPLAG
ncbi:MAG: hypothetical protein R3A10_05525 [Caldilineaceae bacterium]